MHLECPHCGFAKEVTATAIPADVTRVTCPKCHQGFAFVHPTAAQAPVDTVAVSETPADNGAAALPKAGFWIRLVALLIDGIIVTVIQFVFGFLLGLVAAISIDSTSAEILIGLFSIVISLVYSVGLLGYCGQTPGKMIVRIKVIRRDGSDIGYGRAALRELVGKFISGIILGIGYLMAAFDNQKQALHDRLADTYVIKL